MEKLWPSLVYEVTSAISVKVGRESFRWTRNCKVVILVFLGTTVGRGPAWK